MNGVIVVLSDQERENLSRLHEMKPKPRGNMMFRLRGKLKTALDDMDEIILTLESIPDKSAQKVVTDEHVAAAFALSEKLVDVLGYAPVEVFGGKRYVTRTTEVRALKQPEVEKRTLITKPASETDITRVLLVKTHIARLSVHIDSRGDGLV